MKKYCRYCAFCFDAGDYRCSNHPDGKQPHWTEKQIKREINCKNFVLSDLGDVITGKQYRPRYVNTNGKSEEKKFEQLSFIE